MAKDEGGEKSEEATPQQLKKAREEGNVAKSRELSAGVMILITSIFLYFYFPYLMDTTKQIFYEFFQFGGVKEQFKIDAESIKIILYFSLMMMGKLILPFLVLIFVVAFFIEAAQVGLQISTKAIEPKWERINFFVGLPKFLQVKRKLVELVKSLFKIIVLGYVAISIVNNNMEEILHTTTADLGDSAVFAGKLMFEIFFKTSIVVILLGILDLAYQKWQRKQDLKMTKQQIKEEYKQMEGDPLIKQRIREAQRELARKRMMEDVPSADVVVTNPIHYAVALKYEDGGAPVVVAKGQRLMALKIKDLAMQSGVYIHEDPPLAQTLFKTLDIGDEIPENLYKAIAEILAIVYRAKNKKVQ